MPDEAKAAARGGGGLSRLVLWVVIVALLGAVWWLASERNERRFELSTQDGKVVIERGRFFPTGTAEIGAGDPVWGKAYGPIAVPPGARPPPQMEFDDQTALDRTLLDLLAGWARETAKKGDAASMKTAEELVDRASQLPGLTAAQLADLGSLRADLAWDEARSDVDQAGKMVDSALRKLEVVRQGNGAHAVDAAAATPRLQELAHGLRDVLQEKGLAQQAPASGAASGAPDAGPMPDAGPVPDAGTPAPNPDAGVAGQGPR